MKATFRQLFVYNVDVVTAKAGASLPSLSDLTDILDRRRLAGQAHLAVQSGDVEITLGDVEIDRQRRLASLLIRQSDKHSAEAVNSNVRAGVFRAHPKNPGEGGETGAHVFVSLAPEHTIPNRYTCIVEKVPGVEVTLIRRFLNRMLRDEYDANPDFHTYDHPGGQRTRAGTIAKERCLPRLEFEGRPSEALAADVQNGRLTGITLKRAVSHTQVGGVPFITKREATLALDIDHGSLSSNIWRDVRRALRAESATFPVAQIGIRLPGRAKTVSVKVDTQSGAPLTDLYVKSFDIAHISPPMRQSAERVVPQLAARGIPLLVQERNI